MKQKLVNIVKRIVTVCKRIRFTSEDLPVLLYVIIVILLFLKTPSNSIWDGIKAIALFGFLLLPFRMVIYFKVYNTIILAFFVWASTNTIFMVNESLYIRMSTGLTIFLFALLLLNIIQVVQSLYKLEYPEEKNSITVFFFKLAHRYRFIYIILSILILIVVILFGYDRIYSSIYEIDSSAFSGDFNSMYLSFTTFCTIGYGDIVPVSYYARGFIMSQMILSYIVTVMIIPIMIVAFLRLIEDKSKDNKGR